MSVGRCRPAVAHSLDIDHARHRLYAICDDGQLVEVDGTSGKVTNVWPIAGPPDKTFFNPATGRVHAAIGEPGVIDTIDPTTGARMQTATGHGLTRRRSSRPTGFT
ncbi:hypothetical protein [Bradyrhizobium sp. McL0615]|uniref:hypothetical protein n=1 Tax=Bradyrhizobium sp. McL0615 TaxID=3415673 RepID=UPI003CE6D844